MYAGYAEESVCHGAPGVARCGNKDVYATVFPRHLVEITKHSCHETCADILECKRRAMEQFEAIIVARYVAQWYVEVQSVVNYVFEYVAFNVIAK